MHEARKLFLCMFRFNGETYAICWEESMRQSAENITQFYLARQAYRRTSNLAWLMLGAFVLLALAGIVGSALLWPTYTHGFTLYLKWQDALLTSCWCLSLVSIGGCILVLRFLAALRHGYIHGMLSLEGNNRLSGRDLSPKNFISIFWAVATTFACFLAMLVGLSPTVLIGWTLHFSNPALVFFSTILAFLLSLGGLAISVPSGIFFLIGLVCGVSFCRKMGAQQTYQLSTQTIVRLDGSVLAILHPDKPETLFDLQLLTSDDQRQVLLLLRERWVEAEHPWNPTLGAEIETALQEAEQLELEASTGSPTS